MTGQERILALLNNQPADRVGFWIGHPSDEAKVNYCNCCSIPVNTAFVEHAKKMGQQEEAVFLATQIDFLDVELIREFQCDMFWCSPELDPEAWKHPAGKPMFDILGGKERHSLSQPGIFADCESVKEIENFDWPDAKYLDFTSTINLIDKAKKYNVAIFGGMWTCYFHTLCDFFGMENYFMKMHTHPEVIEAATEKVLDFYEQANIRCFEEMGDKIDVMFFGNDLGSQESLMISPKSFDKFILPGIKRVVALAHKYGKKVALHSCGAISSVIPKMIDAGIDALHPLQAKAKGMDAESLVKFKDKIVFIGGIDTQHLLPFGSPDEVRKEVERIISLLGPRLVVSPSHEALLKNVSYENVIAMRDAVMNKN
ncbi:MAG: uroporphyrinogen decarboxylase family protein [Thermoguttaceae bacterium]